MVSWAYGFYVPLPGGVEEGCVPLDNLELGEVRLFGEIGVCITDDVKGPSACRNRRTWP